MVTLYYNTLRGVIEISPQIILLAAQLFENRYINFKKSTKQKRMTSSYKKNSSYFEQDSSFIVKKVRKCFENDKKVSDFFDLLQSTDEKIRDELYDPVNETNELAVITDSKSYPRQVEEIALSAKHRVYFGCFAQINHFSCIVDNKVLVWPIEGKTDDVTVLDEKAELVTCVACGKGNKNVWDDSVKNVIVVATNRYIVIYPFTDKIITQQPVKVGTTSIVTAISISDYGQIFLGTDCGDIFWVDYSLDGYLPKCNVRIRCLSTNFAVANLPRIIRFSHSVTQISLCPLDDESFYLAVLDSKSNIQFYFLKNNKLEDLSRFEAKTKHYNYKVVCISSIPISDSTFMRFIAFTENGDRLFFSWGYNAKGEKEIFLKQIRLGPSSFSGNQLIDANYSLGFTVFMFRKSIALTRTCQKAHVADINPHENIVILNIPTDGLIFARNDHIFNNHQFKLFNNEVLWQHLISAAPGYLMTTDGIHIITFSLPVDRLSLVLNKNNNSFTDSVRNWMQENYDEGESSATSLLLASRFPPSDRAPVLMVLNQFSQLKSNREELDTDIIPESCSAFILRASRLLAPIWNSSIFVKKNKNIQVNPLYKELPPNFVQNLKTLLELATEYLQLKVSNGQKKDNIKESSTIQKFIIYLQTVISTITFIQIMKEQNAKIITDAMEKIAPEYKERLLNNPFGVDEEKLKTEKLFESLRDFASALFKGSNNMQSLASRIFHECPDFFNEEDAKILEAMESLEKLDKDSPVTQIPVLQAACDVFVKYASRPLKLNEICYYFSQFQFYQGIIDVVLSRATALDRVQNGLQWYKAGCSDENIEGREAFDKRYYCYQYIFEITNQPKAFNLLIKTSDELFHICLYQYLIDKGDVTIFERLFSATTQFLEPYLKDKAPQYLWMYKAYHKKYDSAAKLLLNLVEEDNENSLDTRMSWLLKVIGFARGSGSGNVLHKAKLMYKLGQVQEKYNKIAQDQDKELKKLLSEQELFSKCTQNRFWDLSLIIISYCNIESLDKRFAVSKIWSNLIHDQLHGRPLSIVQKSLVNMVKEVDKTSIVMDPSILVPLLEDFKSSMQGPRDWTLDTLIQFQMPDHDILEGYLRIINDEHLSNHLKADYIYIAAKLISRGANIRNHDFSKAKEWFIQNAKGYDYFEDAYHILTTL